jgi:mono/diheme cytochrome c family protein
VTLTYSEGIGPLLETRCGTCHADDGIQGLNLTTFDALMEGGTTGPAILPGDAEGSLLVQKQSGDQAHFGQLSADELELVIEWISAGAPE